MNINEQYPLCLLPKIISDFVKVLEKTTDASPAYLAVSGFAVLSTLVGSSVEIAGDQKLNEYILLIGPTGVSHKSTAQKWAVKLLMDIFDKHKDKISREFKNEKDESIVKHSSIQLITSFSAEGLETAFQGHGISVLLTPKEYREVFNINNRQSQSNTIPALTHMYDGQYINTVLRGSKFEAIDYSLTILTCSTSSWLKESLNSDMALGGFWNRHLITISEGPDEFLATPERPNQESWNCLVEAFAQFVPNFTYKTTLSSQPIFETPIKRISMKEAPIVEHWVTYNKALFQKMRKGNELERSILAREATHAIKLAGLRCIAENRNDLDSNDLNFGIAWAEISSQNLLSLFEGEFLTPDETKLLNFIRNTFQNETRGTRPSDISKHFGGTQERWRIAEVGLLSKSLIEKANWGLIPVSALPCFSRAKNSKEIKEIVETSNTDVRTNTGIVQ